MHVEGRYLATRRRGHLGDSFPPTVAQCPRRWRLPGRCLARPAGSSTRRLRCAAHTRPGGGCPTSTHHLCSWSAVLPPHRPAEPLSCDSPPSRRHFRTPRDARRHLRAPARRNFRTADTPGCPSHLRAPARRIFERRTSSGARHHLRARSEDIPLAPRNPGGAFRAWRDLPCGSPPPGGACRPVLRRRRLTGRCYARPVRRGFTLQTIRVRRF